MQERPMDVPNLILWAVALIVSIILALWGVKTVSSRKIQNQKTGVGSTSIQSGRDTKISNDR